MNKTTVSSFKDVFKNLEEAMKVVIKFNKVELQKTEPKIKHKNRYEDNGSMFTAGVKADFIRVYKLPTGFQYDNFSFGFSFSENITAPIVVSVYTYDEQKYFKDFSNESLRIALKQFTKILKNETRDMDVKSFLQLLLTSFEMDKPFVSTKIEEDKIFQDFLNENNCLLKETEAIESICLKNTKELNNLKQIINDKVNDYRKKLEEDYKLDSYSRNYLTTVSNLADSTTLLKEKIGLHYEKINKTYCMSKGDYFNLMTSKFKESSNSYKSKTLELFKTFFKR